MIERCYRPSHVHYHNYGGRGIIVCPRWLNGESMLTGFQCFLEDMGEGPQGMTLDRWPEKNGNYEPGNCRWATEKQQKRNTRVNRMITAFGKTQCMAAWGEELGIRKGTISERIRRGFIGEAALQPVLKNERGERLYRIQT